MNYCNPANGKINNYHCDCKISGADMTKVVARLKQKGGAGLKSDNKLHNGMEDTSGVMSTTSNNMHYTHFQ